ncbi:uncharacterized protein LACBIDRAFT_321438 [Laccaria bicolor S238N-H82]|uniref:Predicted protein n=1 Tax=Laccaria bicolor (strain S238N-H82 / ATCC MYA-4686) TaxID=486041 RepID=B0CQD1_LACBS|nr:uncharacterized protein LACBIDRAFT_321438 [Laccaria bicolor S238N-H82]EDR16185.1 predicted protein [Laccaria bicolor S238N-H82]|eukprot:XP_001874393.1 predicted protein [Laccaria bicolor S238N-H82]
MSGSTACDPAPNASLGDDKASPKVAVQQTQEERERILQWARDIVKKYPYQPRKVRQEAARAKICCVPTRPSRKCEQLAATSHKWGRTQQPKCRVGIHLSITIYGIGPCPDKIER